MLARAVFRGSLSYARYRSSTTKHHSEHIVNHNDCFPAEESEKYVNKWLDIVACIPSYHSLGLFFSLVNASCSYDPIGWGVPYNHFLFSDTKEGLAETSLQVLSILLNHTPSALIPRDTDGAHAKVASSKCTRYTISLIVFLRIFLWNISRRYNEWKILSSSILQCGSFSTIPLRLSTPISPIRRK